MRTVYTSYRYVIANSIPSNQTVKDNLYDFKSEINTPILTNKRRLGKWEDVNVESNCSKHVFFQGKNVDAKN